MGVFVTHEAAIAFQSAADAMLVVSANGEITLANDRAIELFGYSQGELVGERIEMLLPDALKGAHVEHRATYGRRPRVRAMGTRAFTAKHRDGTLIPVEIRLAPVDTGDAPMVTAQIRDLRERSDRELGSLMQQRVAASDMLTAALLHEINNPLAVVCANLNLMEARLHRGEVERLGDAIGSASEAASLIASLLKELREFTFAPNAKTGGTDVNVVLERAIRMAGPDASTCIPIERHLLSRAPVVANSVLLGQVFTNLLRNAVEAMESTESAERRIVVRSEDVNDHVRCEIGDRGTGISPEDLARVFDLHFSTKEGSYRGVGLALSRHVIRRWGGRLTVVDRPGWSTTFRIELPTAHAEMPESVG
jgi:PAS domain S-box-containing protein